MAALFAELKRRNVIRMAGLYLVVAWLLVQVAGTVLPMFGAPSWLPRSVVIVLALGFVPTMIFAWVFELTPEGLKRESQIDRSQSIVDQTARKLDIAVIALLLGVGGMMVWARVTRPEAVAPATAASVPVAARETSVAALGADSVAVLPFTNRSAEPDTAYFVDGVHDDLLTQLARNPALTVISRTSMLEYRNTTKNLRQIGRELGVATLLEGAVQRTGKRVRINAQLINVATDAHLWAETFDRELTPENIFDIQSEIAAAIAEALGKTLSGAAAKAQAGSVPTHNAKAYDLYLRAKEQSGKGSTLDIGKVIALYRQALVEDPKFALAMGELGWELTNQYWFGGLDVADRDEARQWIDRALALQPTNPRLRWILADHLYHGQLDYEGALEQLALAEQGLPGSADVYSLRGWILRRAGRPAETIEALDAAAVLDPRSWEVLESLVETHGLLGDLDAAKRWNDRLLAIPGVEPDSHLRYLRVLRNVLGDAKPLDRALAALPAGYLIDVEVERFQTPLLRRDFDRVEQAIDALPDEMVVDQDVLIPKALMRAQLARARGESAQARAFAAQGLAMLDKSLAETPDDFRALMSKALALAILGRGSEARANSEQALGTSSATKDAYTRADLRAEQLRVLAMVADSDELARAFEAYLRLPMKAWYFDGLMLDPAFDAHRQHPAMLALAKRYSRNAAGKSVLP